jgi:hypothetical protein
MFTKCLSFQSVNDLGIVQLTTADVDSLNYITGSKAIEQQILNVQEVSEQGNVNTLLVNNGSNQFVFFMDGDILSGAKQNRVVNTSLFLAPHMKTKIPVSCVEQGRWGFVSKNFSSTDYSAPPSMRHAKSAAVTENLRTTKSFMADQGEIWNRVDQMSSERNVHSNTSNLTDAFDHHRGDLEEKVRMIPMAPGANGLALFLGPELIGIDVFHRRDVYAEYFPKILRGIAFELMRPERKSKTLGEAEARFKTEELIDRIYESPSEQYQGVGVGFEKRFSFDQVTGLRLEYRETLVHLTAIRRAVDQRRRSSAPQQ